MLPASIADVTPEKIAAAFARLAAFARPSRIIVFGSAGRGDPRPNHLDFLVIMPQPVANWRDDSARFCDHLRGIIMPMDILVISEAEAAPALPASSAPPSAKAA